MSIVSSGGDSVFAYSLASRAKTDNFCHDLYAVDDSDD